MAGDAISIAGREHVVVWPPARLSEPDAAYADAVLRDILELAGRSHRLAEALRVAYGSAMFGPGEGAGVDRPGLREIDDERESDQPSMSETVESEVQASVVADPHEESAMDCDPSNDAEDSPQQLLRDNPQLVRRARGLQNYLSLIFYDPELHSLVCYGDAPPAVVAHVNSKLPGRFEVMLAPHHGTQPAPSNMPRAWTCVAQGGARQYKHNWLTKHVPNHASSAPCTHLSGVSGGVLQRWMP